MRTRRTSPGSGSPTGASSRRSSLRWRRSRPRRVRSSSGMPPETDDQARSGVDQGDLGSYLATEKRGTSVRSAIASVWGTRLFRPRSDTRPAHHAPADPWLGPDGVGVVVLLVPVSYTHLRAHETVLDLVCRLLLEKKKQK